MSIPIPDITELVEEFALSLPCRRQRPYPPTNVRRPNVGDGELLLDAFASGESSELTTVTQYVFHALEHMMTPQGNLWMCIALVEMHHLHLIGSLIRNLGVEPKYWRTNKFYWTGGYVSYGERLCSQLRTDINTERASINLYSNLILELRTPEAIAVLRRIQEDEEVHLYLFQQMYRRSCEEFGQCDYPLGAGLQGIPPTGGDPCVRPCPGPPCPPPSGPAPCSPPPGSTPIPQSQAGRPSAPDADNGSTARLSIGSSPAWYLRR